MSSAASLSRGLRSTSRVPLRHEPPSIQAALLAPVRQNDAVQHASSPQHPQLNGAAQSPTGSFTTTCIALPHNLHNQPGRVDPAPCSPIPPKVSTTHPAEQQAAAPQHDGDTKGGNAVSCKSRQPTPAQLTQRISQCSKWTNLLPLLLFSKKSLNHIHTTAALGRLSKLASPHTVQFQDLSHLNSTTSFLLQQLAAHADRLSARELSNSLHSCARLQVNDPAIFDLLYTHLAHKAYALKPQELTNVLWAAASSPTPPPTPTFIDQLLDATLHTLPTFDPHSLSLTAWSLAKLSHTPHTAWLTPFVSCCSHHLPTFPPRSLSMLSWSFAKLHQPLPPAFLTSLESATLPLLPVMNTQDLSNTIWALATTRHMPSPSWLTTFHTASLPLLPAFPPQALSIMLWSLAALAAPPPVHWLAAFYAACHASLDSLEPQAISNILWSLARLNLQPPPPLLSSLLSSLSLQLPNSSPQSVSNTIWALGRMQLRPESTIEAALLTAIQNHGAKFSTQELANVACGLARMRAEPSSAWAAGLLRLVGARLGAFSAQGLGNVLWAVARMGWEVGDAWMLRWYDAAEGKLGQMADKELGCVAWAVGRVGVVDDAFVQRLVEEAGRRLEGVAGGVPQGAGDGAAAEAGGVELVQRRGGAAAAGADGERVPAAAAGAGSEVYGLQLNVSKAYQQQQQQAQQGARPLGPHSGAGPPHKHREYHCAAHQEQHPPAPQQLLLSLQEPHHHDPAGPNQHLQPTHPPPPSLSSHLLPLPPTIIPHHPNLPSSHPDPQYLPHSHATGTLHLNGNRLTANPTTTTTTTTIIEPQHTQATHLNPQHTPQPRGPFNSQALTNIIWLLGQLRHPPDAPFLATLFSTTQPRLPTYHPIALPTLLWSLARLNCSPPDPWLHAVCAATRSAAASGALSAHSAACAAWSLARLTGAGQQRGTASELVSALLHGWRWPQGAGSAAALSGAIWAAATLQCELQVGWLDRFLNEAQGRSFSAKQHKQMQAGLEFYGILWLGVPS